MIEIELRCWDKITKSIRQVEAIYFDKGSIASLELVRITVSETIVRFPDDVILMRFSGFDDVAGRKIHEGDLLRDLEHPNAKELAEVFFHPLGYWALRYIYPNGVVDDEIPLGEYVCDGCASAFKVAGNIYENPELLEGENGN